MKLIKKFYKNIHLKSIPYHLHLREKNYYLDDEILGEILKLPTIGKLQNSRRDRTIRVETIIGGEDHGQF